MSTNVWWLAIPALGESWHSLHHAEPTAARHGVLKGQLDLSALMIRGLERTGLAHDVRAAEAMLRATGGSIVTIASTRAHMSEPDTYPYAASKGGIAQWFMARDPDDEQRLKHIRDFQLGDSALWMRLELPALEEIKRYALQPGAGEAIFLTKALG